MKVHEDCPLVEGYLWSYKSQFNANHDISIYDVPVELYAEDSKQEAISNGVYSLMEDRWLKEPKKIPPTDNDEDVQAKYQELKDAIDKCDDSEVANELLDKIYTMRKSGLAEVGEFSTENMAFKLLRNDGSIDKLKKLKKEKVDKQLSLESYQLQERDKSEYLNNSDNQSALRKFSILHQNLIAPLPKPYDGDRDIEAILYYLGSTDGLVAKIKTPIETVIFNSRNLNHLIDDNEPERLQDLSKIKETLKNPNLIIKTNEPKTKHNYIKAFGNQDLMKAQLVVVKVLEDGTFYVTTFRLKNRKFLDKLKEGQIIYDLSDTYANIDESISYDNIITYSEKNVKFQKHFKETFNQTNKNKKLTLQNYNEEMYTDEKDVPPLHDYAIIFKYQEPWPDGKLAYRAIMKLTTGSSYRMQSWSYTKEGMINIVKKQWPYADIVDKTNEPVSESYNEENVEKLETLEDLKNYFDTGLETIDCEITYFPYEPTQKVLRITSASPKINREWLKEVSNGKIKLVGVKQHKNRFGGWIKMYDHFYGYVDNINESKNDLYIIKAMVVGLGGKDIKYLVYRNDRLSDTSFEDLATPLPKTQWQEILNQQGKNYRIGNAVFTFKKYFDPDGGNYIILRYTPQTAEGTLTLQDIKKQLSKQQIKIAHVESYKQYQRYGRPTTAYRLYIDKQYEDKLRNFVKVNTPVADIQIQESIRNTGKFNVGDKVRKGKRIATIKKVDSPEKGYLDVEFEDEKDNGSYPKQYFRKITESKDMITTINKLIDNVNKTMKTASKNPKEVDLYKLEQETNKDGEVLLTLYKGNKKFMTAKLVGNTLLGDDIVGHLKSVKSFKYNENIDNEFKHTHKFNSVGDYKDKLKDMRAKYDVQDVIEDNNLLHLVYDGDTHIGTFNNTKLEYYSDDTMHIKECYNITKLLEEVYMEIKKYKVKLKADNGEEVKVTTTATSAQQAIKQVCDQQNAPESAVVSVKECDLDEGFSSIINKLSQLLG